MKKYIFFIFCLFIAPLYAQHSEQIIKGVFLSKFIQYVYWPNNYFDNKEYISIIYFTNQELPPDLISEFKKIKIKGLFVKLIRIDTIKNITNADVIFIAKDQKDKCKKICKAYSHKPVLIVSEFNGAAIQGSHLNIFITQNSTISFEINPKAFKKSNLSPDAGILTMGKIVE